MGEEELLSVKRVVCKLLGGAGSPAPLWKRRVMSTLPLVFFRRGMRRRCAGTRSCRSNCLAEATEGMARPTISKSPCLYYNGSCDISMGNVGHGLKKNSL